MEHAQLKRRLTAVLLADVVGYSRLMSVDERPLTTQPHQFAVSSALSASG